MAYAVVVNGQDQLECRDRAEAMKRFEEAKASCRWVTVVRSSRKDCDVIAYWAAKAPHEKVI